MDTERHVANMERPLHGGAGHTLQHFMSHAPWSGQVVCRQLQAERKAIPALAPGRTLMRAESAEEQAGTPNAGASRPSKGRRGQGEGCRVDPCLTSANGGRWAMVDGAWFLPAEWLGAAFPQRRTELGMPVERRVETQLQWGVKMRKRGKAHGVPFALLACDARYGRDRPLRAEVDAAGVRYAAHVPADPHGSLREPRVGMPPQRRQRGRPRTRLQGLRGQGPQEVRALAPPPQTTWPQVQVRPTERGRLTADCAVRRVWTVAAGQRPPHRMVGETTPERGRRRVYAAQCPAGHPTGMAARGELPPLLPRAPL
jgi:SRSO17 transposase